MTILELLEWGNNKLKTEKIDSSMLDAEILLAYILRLPRSKLFTGLGDDIDDQRSDQYRFLIKRRMRHEPIATIISKKSFYGRNFLVNRFVLSPRPETEILIENAISSAKNLDGETWFADIGTGSGAIAVTLAIETKLPVIAIDISNQALTVARTNAETHRVADLIDFKNGDTSLPLIKLFRGLKNTDQPPPDNLIICANLPYLSTKQWEDTQPKVHDWEPRVALEAGTDGLDAYWKLFRELSENRKLLSDQLTTIIEIDPSQSKAIKALVLHLFSEAKIEIKKDLAGLNRIVIIKLN
ncbi:MAG: peptide chain release factor N(5)-glutamine methyltransferase [Candidatus Uhrbacteria bacterium]